ncbi:MAG: DUF2721 domain-containing protein [Cyanobacteria bacterium]|nr:DUF2721 domain-containing protein [Cyanobacteriota bacterium]
MIELKTFITQSLSPALAISASGMLTLGMQNRLSTVGTRVRQLNREIILLNNPTRSQNLTDQIQLFLMRGVLIRNALFLMYSAICLMVFTAFALALSDLGIFNPAWKIPIWTFLMGLGMILVAVVIEAFEVLLILKALKLDGKGISNLDEPQEDSF